MNSPYPPGECGSILRLRRCSERMVSKAARREPTSRGYHTGLRVAERESPDKRCALSRKSRHGNPRHKYGGATLGCSCGSRSRFQETWPVINEQTENCVREEH